MKENRGRKELPESIKHAIEMFGLSDNEFFWDKKTGQPNSFIRFILRRKMEDRGDVKFQSDQDTENTTRP